MKKTSAILQTKAARLRPTCNHQPCQQPVNRLTSPSLQIGLKRILVPIDFSPTSIKALQYAVPFAERLGASICLVHVVEPASFVNDLTNLVLIKSDKDQSKQAHNQLLAIAQKEIEEWVPVNVHVRVGKPFKEIVDLAQAHAADLIVIATHGHKGLAHALLGSTTEKVVRGAPCPVLVVRQNEREFA